MRVERPDPLEAFLEALADRLADKLAARAAPPAPRYAIARENPIGSARAFLDAARRGDFPTFKRGRTVAALWADVERYVEGRRRRTNTTPADDDRALLMKAGLRLHPGGGAGARGAGR